MQDTHDTWSEVADAVYVRRHRFFDMNVTLVVGDGRALVVDTRTTHRQGRELLDAIRAITSVPLTVVNTHAHFDHFFGNAVFRPAPIWGHRRCVEVIERWGEAQRARVIALFEQDGQDDLARELAEVELVAPDHTVEHEHVLDVGGRAVHLRYHGRGHTDSDITLEVADAGVLIAGDLVEEGAPPSYNDAFPLDWPATVRTMLDHVRGRVVPGHGAVVDERFVRSQLAEIEALAEVARRAYAAGAGVEDVVGETPFSAEVSREALGRAFGQLRGEDLSVPR